MNRAKAEEFGSEFHWLGSFLGSQGRTKQPWGPDSTYFGSGRDALRSLMTLGRDVLGWRRMLVPSFFCLDVASSLLQNGFEIDIYYDDPRAPIEITTIRPDEVALVVNTFGIRRVWRRPPGCEGGIIEDHTHDPWSDWAMKSDADYCFASIRKTLPVPDGAVAWSPAGRRMPSSPSESAVHHRACLLKLEAMLLKTLYLEGKIKNKDVFRALAKNGEAEIADGPVSSIEPLSEAIIRMADWRSWRARRLQNYSHLAARFSDLGKFRVLTPLDTHAVPFSVVVICDDHPARNDLQERLIAENVYPSILWPLDGSSIPLPTDSNELSKRILSFHCDGRYNLQDMERIAQIVEGVLQK